MNDERRQTAIHEAGHAVAHLRLRPDRLLGKVSIVPGPDFHGRTSHEDEWARDEENVQSEVLVSCAGYAACVAAGMDEATARSGCDDDFERAHEIIAGWNLAPFDEQLRRAVALMQLPENRRAVQRLADELLTHEELDGDEADVIVTIADENTPEAEAALARWRLGHQPNRGHRK